MHQVDKVHTYVVENLFALPHIARKRHDVHRTAHRMPWRNIVCISAVCLVEPDHKRPLEARVGYFAVLPLQLEFRGESPELLGRREAGVVLKCGVLREEVPEGIGFFWIGSLALYIVSVMWVRDEGGALLDGGGTCNYRRGCKSQSQQTGSNHCDVAKAYQLCVGLYSSFDGVWRRVLVVVWRRLGWVED
jgi:hypothetical protein